LFGLFVPSPAAVRKSEQFLQYFMGYSMPCSAQDSTTACFFDDNIFIVLILYAYKWLPPFAADV